MGGIVEVNSLQSGTQGLHGQLTVSGGSYDTASGSTQLQYSMGKNTFGVNGSAA